MAKKLSSIKLGNSERLFHYIENFFNDQFTNLSTSFIF